MKTTVQNKTKIVLPQHIAIIPDGNRRWAKDRNLPTLEGHRRGAKNFDRLMNAARDMGIDVFTTWVFSSENWKRNKDEIDYLFDMAREFTDKYTKKFLKEGTRFIHLGRKDRLPEDLIKTLSDTEEKTKDCKGFTVAIGFDYGGHDELIRTINLLIEKKLEITEENIAKYLDTKDLPNPDLLIRTSGEQRLSGFMSWQSAYAEYFFADVHFPDFGPNELKSAINEYCTRERRFGGDINKKANLN